MILEVCLVNSNQVIDVSSPCRLITRNADNFAMRASEEVIFVHVHYRHGARSPEMTYPNDPYTNKTIYWPEGWKQLSKLGIMQQYKLGQYLRDRYQTLLPEKYNRDDICVYSTDRDRTIMSAEANLAGLYPPTADQKWNEKLPWQPIPVHTLSDNFDYLLHNEENCPKLLNLQKEVFNNKEFAEFEEKNKEVFAFISEKTGSVINSSKTVAVLYNTFFCQWIHNLTLPKWASEIFFTTLQEMQDYYLTLQVYSLDLQKLQSGPLLGRLVSHMKGKVDGTLSEKMVMYSGHETNIAAFMKTLGFTSHLVPGFADTILVELHKPTEGEYFVQVIYRNNTSGSLLPISVHGCEIPCPMQKFINLTASRIPDNWFEECKV